MMFLSESKKRFSILIVIALFSTIGMLGCGLRQSNTGSLSSRIINANGDAVAGAKVFSIFDEARQTYTALDGKFYLEELPAGNNNIVILHPDYALEERQVVVQSNETTVIESIKLDVSNAPNRIDNIKVVSTTSTSATITWNTYKKVISNIDYGTTRSYGSLYREQRADTSHSATLIGLSPETLYHFRVQYIDAEAESHYSYDYSFKTIQGDSPSAPLSISVASFSHLEVVRVEWAPATSPSVISYNIFRREKGQSWQKITDMPLPSNLRFYEDKNADSGTFWQYGITAVNDRGANSDIVSSKVIFTPGIVKKDIEITTDESPVLLTSDLVIAPGANLVINAGVEFEIAEADSMKTGLDTERVEIIVQGRIAINGSSELPVVFKPLDGTGRRDHWRGITILSDKTGISELHHISIFGCAGYAIEVETDNFIADNLQVRYCENGIKFSGIRNNFSLENTRVEGIASEAIFVENCRRFTLSNSFIDDTKVGIRVHTNDTEDSFEMDNSEVYANEIGLTGTFGKAKLAKNLIVVKTGTGIVINSLLNAKSNYIDHCTIDALNGIRVVSGTITIENNIIANITQTGETGINNVSILSPSYSYNAVFGFNSAYIGCGSLEGGVTTDPRFIGGNPYDYHLSAGSTLRIGDRHGNELGRYGESRI